MKQLIAKKNKQVILRQFFPELIQERLYGWFQQNSATAHIKRCLYKLCPMQRQKYQQWWLASMFS
jgi:hypothetical protein